jgi:pimeloyl-[acyl-carrier protein] methyl ester esterase
MRIIAKCGDRFDPKEFRSMKLVLLPGMDGTGILFEPLIRALPKNLSPIVQPYPGDVPLSYEELLPHVQSALPMAEPFIILAESFSGPLALRIAATNPPGLKGVILCASFIYNPTRFPKSCRRLIQPFVFGRWPAWLGARALVAGYSKPTVFELVQRAHKLVTPAVLAARARAITVVNAEDALAACCLPILYIAGSRDRLVPKRNPTRIQRVNPGVKIVALPAPHLVLQNAPEAAAKVIAQFAAEVA